MLYGHPQDAILYQKSSLSRSWHDEKLRVDREATKKEKLEKYYNRGTRNLERLKVNDPVCIQNNRIKRWDRYGRVMECYHQSRRYLIKLESGLMIRRNRIHLRKKYSHPKNDINSTEPSNYLNEGDVKNNEPNDDSDDELGNNFNRAVTETESSCDEPRPRRSDRQNRRLVVLMIMRWNNSNIYLETTLPNQTFIFITQPFACLFVYFLICL